MKFYTSNCKNKQCGALFTYNLAVLEGDRARGLSPTDYCPECRKKNYIFRKNTGVSYWVAPIETDDAKRCWGEFGFGRLVHHRSPPKISQYKGIPIDPPPERFQRIAPVANALVGNLEDPKGTKVSILIAPTGTGKSTWVPYRLLRSTLGEYGRICVTSPRKAPLREDANSEEATSVPGYIARELCGAPGIGAGQEVGVLFRGETTQHDQYTKLLFITDGILIRWLVNDQLDQFNVLMIDEAHEQSKNMEMIFALLRQKLPLYPKLRVVIASATIDHENFMRFFEQGGRSEVFVAKPVEIVPSTPHEIILRSPEGENGFAKDIQDFKPPSHPYDLPEAIARITKEICTNKGFTKLGNPSGDILVFVPTISLVKQTIMEIEKLKLPNLKAFPYHAQLFQKELIAFLNSEDLAQSAQKENRPTKPQRIMVATNYAQTSVTLSNLTYVIDGGLTLEPEWDTQTASYQYSSKPHTKAGCKQRAGRVGRTKPGEYFRLYSDEMYSKMADHPRPEITRSPLDRFLLTAKIAGVDDIENFQWLGRDKTQEAEITRALTALKYKGAFDRNSGELTRKGVELERIEVQTIDLARAMSDSDIFGCTLEVATFLGFISQDQSIFDDSQNGLRGYARWRTGCYDDLEFYLRIFHHWSYQKPKKPSPPEVQDKEKWQQYKRDLKEFERLSLKHENWTEKEGLNFRALNSIADSRSMYLRQFSERTHTDVQERELDFARLHRVRFVLARVIPEWIYKRTEHDIRGRIYAPLDPNTCPCKDSVRIDPDSSCAPQDDFEAFLCIERAKVGRNDDIFAKHIVRVSTDWLPVIRSQDIFLLSKAMHISLIEQREIVAGTRDRILLKPDDLIVQSSFEPDKAVILRILRIQTDAVRKQRSDTDPSGIRFLAEDLKNKAIIMVHMPEVRSDDLNVGQIVRGHVVDNKSDFVVITQGKIHAELMDNSKVRTGTVVDIHCFDDKKNVEYALLQLEPGVIGILHYADVESERRQELDKITIGQGFDVVVVDKNKSGSIRLVTPKVFEASKRQYSVGDVFYGKVIEFDYEEEKIKRGARVEIAAGKVGYLHRQELSRQKDLSQRLINNLRQGSRIKVLIKNVDERGIYLGLDIEPLHVGKVYTGYVEGFLPSKDPRYIHGGVFVQLDSKHNGFVPYSRIGSRRLNTLRVGDKIEVEILSINKGKNDKTVISLTAL